MRAYKSTNPWLESPIASRPEDYVIYKMHEWVTPRVNKPPLFCWKNVESIRNSVHKDSILRFFECEIEVTPDQEGTFNFFKENCITIPISEGTIFADKVKLVRELSKEEVGLYKDDIHV